MSLEWQKIKEEKFKAGRRNMLRKTFRLPNGKVDDYDVRDSGPAVGIVAFVNENTILMERIFRPGPEMVVTEIPGGGVDEGEDPQKAAERELLEETGYKGELELAGKVVDDAYSNLIRYVFVAKNCVKVQEPERSEDEIMEIVEMTLDEFRRHLRTGQLTDTELGYLALDYMRLL